ncbi:MAG: 50S ribosomal protein L4 [Candidatus Eisenbacteria bacterium]
MAEATLQTFDGQAKGAVKLPDHTFGIEPKEQAVYETVKCILANQRQGTSSTKTRHEVSGSDARPWRQKGTGRARAGTSTSPLWIGGGRIHGPKPRDFSIKVPRKVRRLALKSVLSDKAKNGAITVVDDCPVMDAPKTKPFADFWKSVAKNNEKCLLVVEKYDANLFKSVENLARLFVTTANNLNTFDAINVGRIVFTAKALEVFVEKAE